jgi:hypothetical protein
MSADRSPSALETIAGGLPVQGALTAVAALAGGPLAALLPVLANTLAADRQRKRIETALLDIEQTLVAHRAQLDSLTDQQYKFVNEVVLALLHTTDGRKVELLKLAVRNGLELAEMPDHESVFLSRIIRDMSAAEADFLAQNFGTQRIWLNETPMSEARESTLAVDPRTAEGHIVSGLITLGLVSTAEPTWDDSGLLRFSPIVAKLLAVLRPDA